MIKIFALFTYWQIGIESIWLINFSVPSDHRHWVRFYFIFFSWFSAFQCVGMCGEARSYFSFPGNTVALCNRLPAAALSQGRQTRTGWHNTLGIECGQRCLFCCYPSSYLYLVLPTLVLAACMFSWYTGCFVRSSNILNKFIPWHDFRFAWERGL